mmetsp:Transcript_114407/g.324612  ORF Transcript_114407/g.324612 Transcript_114407/m.324612 type:complete len:373 (+) Transcript_114407:638-1756(+)
MLGGPDQRVHVQLQLRVWQLEQRLEAVRVDRLQELVELDPVVGVALEVALDHVASAFENHLEDLGDLLRDEAAEARGQRGQEVQHLRVPCLRHVALVVGQDGFQQRRNEPLCHLLHGDARLRELRRRGRGRLAEERLHQPQRVPLDVAHQPDVGETHHLAPLLGSPVRDELAADLVDLQHLCVDVRQLGLAGDPHRAGHPLVHAQDERDLAQHLLVLRELHRTGAVKRRQDCHPPVVEEMHQLQYQPLLVTRGRGAYHVADCLEVGADMQVLELRDILGDVGHHLLHERALLALLDGHELPRALLANLQERVHRHLLDAREGLVHELEQLEDDRLQELPVGPQEPWVLADDVHDVAGHDRFVLLAPLHLAQA